HDADIYGKIKTIKDAEDFLINGHDQNFKNMYSNLVELNPGMKRTSIDSLKQNISFDADYEKRLSNTANTAAACLQLTKINIINCTSAVNDLIELANFRNNIIAPEIWYEFMTNKELQEGIRIMALTMIERLKSGIGGRFFDDLVESFQSAGLLETDAIEAAWKAIALYGNGGPNMGLRIEVFDLPAGMSKFYLAMHVISVAVTQIDYQQRLMGHKHYVYPMEMSGGCLSPKPYHFWLNAFFARELVKRGYSAEVAQMATFIVAKGYHLNRDINGAGSGIEKILSKSSNHPTNRVIRTDLSMAAAGVVYGSLFGQDIHSFSIGNGVAYLEKNSGDVSKISDSTILSITRGSVQAFYAWDSLFKPNIVLEYFQAQQK
ncbi:MAG: hypothetical protein KDD45_05470, partial [Bdellovibrionales bacterium]|nr:hypothetical protein [Bdellovibrionales bacterium]